MKGSKDLEMPTYKTEFWLFAAHSQFFKLTKCC